MLFYFSKTTDNDPKNLQLFYKVKYRKVVYHIMPKGYNHND